MLAAPGFGQRHLNHDHRWRADLVEVIFAWYIVHQTALIALAVWLKPLQLGGALEAVLVVIGTVITCVVTAEVARRVAAPAVRVLPRLAPDQSTFAPDTFTTCAHFFVSAAMKRANSAGG